MSSDLGGISKLVMTSLVFFFPPKKPPKKPPFFFSGGGDLGREVAGGARAMSGTDGADTRRPAPGADIGPRPMAIEFDTSLERRGLTRDAANGEYFVAVVRVGMGDVAPITPLPVVPVAPFEPLGCKRALGVGGDDDREAAKSDMGMRRKSRS